MSEAANDMRADWNSRAREDAHYYVAFGSRDQDEESFLATAAKVVGAIEAELKRLPPNANPRALRALEIGCGPGRLLKPLSRHFGEIHGVDVSDEMIGMARQRMTGIRHAHVHATDGASLLEFADNSFDFVYSYAVFQHIPSREVVVRYMHEISRVLKPGGIFKGQFSGLPPRDAPDTWAGVSFSSEEIRAFTLAQGLDLLALEGMHTQYMWTTWRKPPAVPPAASGPVTIRRVTNAFSSEPVVPHRGVLSAASVWTVNLPERANLNILDVLVEGRCGTVVYVGPPDAQGLQQINVMLPENLRTGLLTLELRLDKEVLCQPAWIRVIPAGPAVPRILSITDGINLVQEGVCTSGLLKVQLEEVPHPEMIAAEVDGLPARDVQIFCTDPLPSRYEVNFRLPEGIQPGPHQVRMRIGKRSLPPRDFHVAAVSA